MRGSKQCVLVFFLLASAMACTLDDGKPWTTFQASAELKWDATGRIQADGRFLTAKNYLIDFEEVQFEFRELVVTLSADEAISFDPGSPPPGYTLCHQGHCHNEANQLIPYEEIEAELNGGQSESVVTQSIDSSVSLDTNAEGSEQSLTLGSCSDELGLCVVGPTNVKSVGLFLGRVVIKATVEAKDGNVSNPWILDVDMVVDQQLDKMEGYTLNADGPEALSLDVTATVLPTLWDQFEFSALNGVEDKSSETEFKTVFESALSKHVPVTVE